MPNKRSRRSLSLSKETLARLSNADLQLVGGGYPTGAGTQLECTGITKFSKGPGTCPSQTTC